MWLSRIYRLDITFTKNLCMWFVKSWIIVSQFANIIFLMCSTTKAFKRPSSVTRVRYQFTKTTSGRWAKRTSDISLTNLMYRVDPMAGPTDWRARTASRLGSPLLWLLCYTWNWKKLSFLNVAEFSLSLENSSYLIKQIWPSGKYS